MTETLHTVQFDNGAITKKVPTSRVVTFVKKYFADYMQDGDSVCSWEFGTNSRYYGVKSYGEVQDYPQAMVTDTFEEV